MQPSLIILLILTLGLSLASLLGYLAQRIKLPTLVGFLVAGYLIGPHSPSYVADTKIAEQLAEIGVILMLFSVGLHFKSADLLKFKTIAIPGAVVQTAVATCVTMLVTHSLGWPIESGVILGLAIGVASTFVLARVLSDNRLLDTPQGHIAIGWLIVEDIFTVIILVLLPMIEKFNQTPGTSEAKIIGSVLLVLAKFAILWVFLFTIGYRIVTHVLVRIARVKSQELFTLTVLALVFLIATGSAAVFGTSLALGAFLAGMVIGKTNVKHQAAANALSLKDTFTIIFFLSVGMLFNPFAIVEHFKLFVAVILIILVAKPLAAFLLILAYRLPIQIALTVAIALAQIGEFSFILAEEARRLDLLPEEGYDIIVVCALLSISLNPILFSCIGSFQKLAYKIPFFNRIGKTNAKNSGLLDTLIAQSQKRAIVIGYGAIGQEVTQALQKFSYEPVIIEHNIDTVSQTLQKDVHIIYGDASFQHLLEAANIETANLLVITTPYIERTLEIIEISRELNPHIEILARIHYIDDIPLIKDLNIHYVCSEADICKSFVAAITALQPKII